MLVVYLDQWVWIQLARVAHGKQDDPQLVEMLHQVQERIQARSLIFPLSAVHYLETARIANPDQRERLGSVMWELSQGQTFASSTLLVTHELEVALANRFPWVSPRPFTLIGQGARHAFGYNLPQYEIPEPYRSHLNGDLVTKFETAANRAIEMSFLTGKGPEGITMGKTELSQFNLSFMRHLENLRPSLATHLLRDQWSEALIGLRLLDIWEPIGEVLRHHNIDPSQFSGLGKQDLTALVREMPSQVIELQLSTQIVSNPALKPKLNDLEDWAGLGPAAAYCDVVVCEKHYANLLLRGGFSPKARILTSLNELAYLIDYQSVNRKSL